MSSGKLDCDDMRILWISIESPLPMNTGGRVGVMKRLIHLSREHMIYYFFPYDKKEETKFLTEIKEYCCEVHGYKRKLTVGVALRTLLYPYTVASRNIYEMKKDIEKCVKRNNIDLINIDFPHMCLAVMGIANKYRIPVVLNEHNIEWKVYQNIGRSQKNLLKKIIYEFDALRLRRYEKRITKKMNFSRVTFVSINDMQEYKKWLAVPDKHLSLVPVGGDPMSLYPIKRDKYINIVFVGNMSYAPNIEGATWFVHNVMPIIRQSILSIKFYIVGREPTVEVKKLECEDVIVTGTVERIDHYYQLANLIVLPLLHGGGVKVKLLEGISYGCMVVSTSKGVEGTLFAQNELIPICDTPKSFAAVCIDLLTNEKNARAMQKQIFDCFLNNYTWTTICERYNKLLLESGRSYNKCIGK